MFRIAVLQRNQRIKEAIFDRSIVSIGRHKVNDIQIGKGQKPLLVSRFHAAIIENEKGDYFVRDLGSKNGVKVDGERVYRRILENGNLIQIGGYALQFEMVKRERVVLRPDRPRVIRHKHMDSDRPADESTEVSTFENRKVNSALSLLAGSADRDSFLTQLLHELCHISSANLGYCAEVVDDGFTLPKYTKGIIGYEIPRPSERLFKEVAKQGIMSVDFALREGEVQENWIATGLPLKMEGQFYFFYLEISKDTYDKNREETPSRLSLLLEKAKEYLPALPLRSGTADVRQFRWKEKMVCNARLSCMAKVMERLKKTSENKLNILICGETGTGKEVAAKKIHSLSGKEGMFVAANCKEVPMNLLPDRLFGHIKGAFSGAEKDKPGVFEEAHKGTLFLDEIGCLDLEMQQMLLRPLREKKIIRLGDAREREVDVKIVFATNEDLEEKAKKGLMRDDFLYGRILEESPPIELLPLKKRKDDIPLLVSFHIDEASDAKVKGIHHRALHRLYRSDYDWPANVQELKSLILKAISIAKIEGREIILWDDIIPYFPLASPPSARETSPCERLGGIERAECEAILRVLRETRGNMAEAARTLGVSRPTLYKKCNTFGIDFNTFKAKPM